MSPEDYFELFKRATARGDKPQDRKARVNNAREIGVRQFTISQEIFLLFSMTSTRAGAETTLQL